MIKYFEHHFTDHDLIHLHNRHIAINMTINGQRVPAFSAETINLPTIDDNNAVEIINSSRARFATKSSEVDSRILYMSKSNLKKPLVNKAELAKDIGHYIRTKVVADTNFKKSRNKTSAVKRLLTKRIPSKVIELDEDQSVRFH
jgi:hypothetical protein